ncbi:MAG: hypothetical protein KAS02_01645 [Candidatus Pacebacteria bacterium]|nr:hypothetical protein [Candidatus Paceibacterota bacterium]
MKKIVTIGDGSKIEIDTSDEALKKYLAEWFCNKKIKIGDILKLRNTIFERFKVVGVGFGTNHLSGHKVVYGYVDDEKQCSCFGLDLSRVIF